MRGVFSVLLLLLYYFPSFSQAGNEDSKKKNLLTGTFGYTFVPKGAEEGATSVEGVFVPSIGIDYFRRVHPKWEIGTMIDFELSNYLIFEKQLNRHKALVITAITAYNLSENWTVFAGGGIELERHKNIFVGRLGGEYAFKLKKDWVLAPGAFYDIKESYDTWAISIAFGREF